MGIFPPDRETWERLCPQWAKDLMEENIPLVPGLPVFDVLYAGYYGAHHTKGIVKFAKENSVGVDFPDGGSCGSAASYWVPDITDPEGAAYVAAWRAGQTPKHLTRCSCGDLGAKELHECPFYRRVLAFNDMLNQRCLCCESCQLKCELDADRHIEIFGQK